MNDSGRTGRVRLTDSVWTAKEIPLWAEAAGGPDRTPLPGDDDVDVAIAGAGYTGLWTALHLKMSDPTIRVAIVEANHVGYGASGRNGGWCSAIAPMSFRSIAKRYGDDQARAFQHAMFSAVDDVLAFCALNRIEADVEKAGWLQIARSPAQLRRVNDELSNWQKFGFGSADFRFVGPGETSQMVKVTNTAGAAYTPHCAAVHPGKLVNGLARVAEALGVRIYEQTPVLSVGEAAKGSKPALRTHRGTLRADVVVRALEGFTSALPSQRRTLAPIYSLMIATEPLPTEVWDTIGWADRVTLNDARRLTIYAQRTADNRIAFGGRGAPYHFGSQVHPRFDLDGGVHASLAEALAELFPVLRNASITHRWGGPLGVARDWFASVDLNRRTGIARAGGYVGDGVSSAALAGATLADLILERETERTRLAWVGHHSPKWEPEPLRWLGITVGLTLPEMIDEAEISGGEAPRRNRVLDRLTSG